jgi:RsiW-degrading membrane proteinase PrsW (M82 family)
MSLFPVWIAAIAPSLSLLLYFYIRDRYEPEPIRLVIKMFFFGMLLVYPILLMQDNLAKHIGESNLLFSFFLSSGIEEMCKWMILYVYMFRHREFDEPYDGIVYAVAISLGFATVENIIYAFVWGPQFSVLLLRALLPISGHALFGVIMGHYLAKAKFEPRRVKFNISLSIFVPIFWHGLYDWLILTSKSYFIWVMIPLMMFLWIRALQKVKQAQQYTQKKFIQDDQSDG